VRGRETPRFFGGKASVEIPFRPIRPVRGQCCGGAVDGEEPVRLPCTLPVRAGKVLIEAFFFLIVAKRNWRICWSAFMRWA